MSPWVPVSLSDLTAPRRLSCLHLVARGAGKRYKQAKLSFHLAKQKDRGANSQKGRIQHELDAAMNGYRQICALLIRRGCSRTRADVNGMTPLMVAAMEGAVGLMGVLVTGKATGKRGGGGGEGGGGDEEEDMLRLIEVEDNSGNTAMHYAMAFKQISAANALEVRMKIGKKMNGLAGGKTNCGNGVADVVVSLLLFCRCCFVVVVLLFSWTGHGGGRIDGEQTW